MELIRAYVPDLLQTQVIPNGCHSFRQFGSSLVHKADEFSIKAVRFGDSGMATLPQVKFPIRESFLANAKS